MEIFNRNLVNQHKSAFMVQFVKYGKRLIIKQAQRRAAMDHCMHCIIPNESYNINHNIATRHCSFEYAVHIHDVIYEGTF